MNCIKNGKYTGDSCFGCEIKVADCEIREKVYRNRWIPISERLPEESIDGITNDYIEYNVSLKFEFAECTRTYKFGDGKWWNNGTDMTKYVIAWQPLPEKYKGTSL